MVLGRSKINRILAITFLFIFLYAGMVYAETPSTVPCWVKGTVLSSDVTLTGLDVVAYYGDTNLKSGVIASDGSYSLNSIGANNDNNIILRVLGAPFASIIFEGFCKTDADPWVVKDFNVSKVANGVTCTSDTICSSGYCSTTCQTRPTNGGGSSGGSSGGTTTDQSSVTTVSDTTETISYTPAELRTALEGMTNEQGSSLFTSTQITQMLANSNDYEFTRTVLVEEIVSATGTISYKVTITTTIKNKTSGDLKDVKVVIEVPKAVSDSASNVQSILPFTTLVNDPVLEFNLARLNAGQEATIVYTVNSTIKPDLNGVTFADPVIRTATKVVVDTTPDVVPDTNTPDVTPDTTPGTETPAAPMDYTLLIVLVVILIIVGVAYFVVKNKKTNKLKF